VFEWLSPPLRNWEMQKWSFNLETDYCKFCFGLCLSLYQGMLNWKKNFQINYCIFPSHFESDNSQSSHHAVDTILTVSENVTIQPWVVQRIKCERETKAKWLFIFTSLYCYSFVWRENVAMSPISVILTNIDTVNTKSLQRNLSPLICGNFTDISSWHSVWSWSCRRMPWTSGR